MQLNRHIFILCLGDGKISSAGSYVLCSAQHTEDTERKPTGMLQTSDIIHGNKRVAEYSSLGGDGIGKRISGFDHVWTM
jgi:hypothetical protein